MRYAIIERPLRSWLRAAVPPLTTAMKLHRLDAIRGILAFYVCLGHSAGLVSDSPLIRALLAFGQEAVVGFFILSGFVIGLTTTVPLPLRAWPRYGMKRFARVYSVWVLAVLTMLMLDLAEKGRYEPQPVGRWIGNALMLQDWAHAKPAVICRPLYGDSPLWSLHYEWWFYMVFPALTLLRDRRSMVHAVGLASFGSSLVYALIPNPASRLLMYLSIWWIGVDASRHLRDAGTVRLVDLKVPLMYVVATAIPSVVVSLLKQSRGETLSLGLHPVLEARHLVSSVMLVVMAFAWRRCRWWGFNVWFGWGAWLAPYSYALYVIHYKSIARATYLAFAHDRAIEVAGYIAVTVAFCWIAEGVVYPRIKSRLGI